MSIVLQSMWLAHFQPSLYHKIIITTTIIVIIMIIIVVVVVVTGPGIAQLV